MYCSQFCSGHSGHFFPPIIPLFKKYLNLVSVCLEVILAEFSEAYSQEGCIELHLQSCACLPGVRPVEY